MDSYSILSTETANGRLRGLHQQYVFALDAMDPGMQRGIVPGETFERGRDAYRALSDYTAGVLRLARPEEDFAGDDVMDLVDPEFDIFVRALRAKIDELLDD